MENGLDVYATDLDVKAIARLPAMFNTLPTAQLLVAPVEKLPFEADFDHIVCSAVFHFAQNTTHFHQMLAELIRVLRPGGSLFVRMASDIGLRTKANIPLAEGVYRIPDGSNRFLLNRKLLAESSKPTPSNWQKRLKPPT